MKSLFSDEGKHGGEATVEAVRKIAELVKINNCQMHPDSIEVISFSLSRNIVSVLSYNIESRVYVGSNC